MMQDLIVRFMLALFGTIIALAIIMPIAGLLLLNLIP
jgi:hypothetical protein